MVKKSSIYGKKYIAYCYRHAIPYIDPYDTEAQAQAAAANHNQNNPGHSATVIVALVSKGETTKKKPNKSKK